MKIDELAANRPSVVLYGAGGHSRSVIGTLLAAQEWTLCGLINTHPTECPDSVLGYPILGGDDKLEELLQQGYKRIHVSIGDNRERQQASAKLSALGFELVSVRSPTAEVLPQSTYGAGTFLHSLSLIGGDCQVGRGCIIQPQSNLGHESRLGDYAQLAPGVHTGGKCDIAEGVFIGLGAAILPRIRVGRYAVIGANAVVREDVPDYAVVAGNPGRIIKILPH